MDVVTAITNDHRLMETLFERLRVDERDRAALIAEVRARFTAHSVAEEEHVYPELTDRKPDEADEVEHGVHEHREAEEKLTALERAGDADFHRALDEFIAAVQHHVEEEESTILPALQESMTDDRLDDLGEAFEERRKKELRTSGE